MAESSAVKAYKYRQEISQVRYYLLLLVPEHFRASMGLRSLGIHHDGGNNG